MQRKDQQPAPSSVVASSSSAVAAAAKNASPPAPVVVPDIGWYGLVVHKIPELVERSQGMLLHLQGIVAGWKEQIPGITTAIDIISKKLATLKRDNVGSNIVESNWGIFSAELTGFIAELNAFFVIVGNEKNTTPQIIAALIDHTKTLPTLLKAFKNLGLDLTIGGLVSSAVEKPADNAPAWSIRSILPTYHIEALQEGIHFVEENLGAAFSSYPETIQDVILIAASELSDKLCGGYLLLDKVACQTGLDRQKLANEPIFTTGKRSDQAAGGVQSAVLPATLSFHQLAEKFSDMYSRCVEKAGYPHREEYYPFPNKILLQRKSFPAALLQQWEQEEKKCQEIWQTAKQTCTDDLKAYIRKYAAAKQTGKVNQLQWLQDNLPPTIQDLKGVIDQLQPDKDLAKILNNIRAVYLNADESITNRITWFRQQESKNDDFIDEAEIVCAQDLPRKALLEARARRRLQEKKSQADIWQVTKQSCSTLIRAEVVRYKEKKNVLHSFEDKIADLERLEKYLPDTAYNLNATIDKYITTKTTKPIFDNIRALYASADQQIKERIAAFNKQEQKHKEDEALLANREEKQQPSLARVPQRSHKEVRDEIVKQDAPALLSHTEYLISVLTQGESSESEENVFDKVLSVVDKCEVKLKEMLDKDIHRECLVDGNVIKLRIDIISEPQEEKHSNPQGDFRAEVAMNSSWVHHVAQLLRNIKKLAQDAKILKAKAALENKSNAIPVEYFQKTLRNLDTTVVSLTKVMQELKSLQYHPVVSKLPPIQDILSSALGDLQKAAVAPLASHPAKQAWATKEDHASDNDKLQGGLQTIRRLCLSLLHQSEKDEKVKEKAKKGLKQADELIAASQDEKSAVAFVLKNPKELYKFAKRAADLVTTLSTLSVDQVMKTAEAINDVFYNLFLLFDEKELRFYMRERYISKFIAADGKSFFGLAELFANKMKEMGYEFEPGRNFPYTQAILLQRQKLLNSENHDVLTKEFMTKRVQSAAFALDFEQKVVPKVNQKALKAEILEKISARRAELISEDQTSYRLTWTKHDKIIALKKMYDKIAAQDAVRIDMSSLSDRERHLLSEKRTGKMFDSFLSLNRDDLVKFITDGIAMLNRQRRPAGCLFSWSGHNDAIKQEVTARSALLRWISLQGYRVEEVMKKLHQHDRKSFEYLNKNNKSFLKTVGEMEKRIPEFLIGRKIIPDPIAIPAIADDNKLESSANSSPNRYVGNDLRQPLLTRKM